MTESTRYVLVVTDQPVAAHGLSELLNGRAGFQSKIVSPKNSEILAAVAESSPSVALLDLQAEGASKILAFLKDISPQCGVVLWAQAVTSELATQAWEMKAAGILLKTASCDLTIRCMEKVSEGELWFDRATLVTVSRAPKVTLTKRESQLVSLLTQGLSNKEIALALFLTEGSVKVYLSRLFKKLGVSDRYGLGLYGLRLFSTGLLSQESAGGPTEKKHPLREGTMRARTLIS